MSPLLTSAFLHHIRYFDVTHALHFSCTVTSSVISSQVEIHEKCTLKDSFLGTGFECPTGTEIKNQKISQGAD